MPSWRPPRGGEGAFVDDGGLVIRPFAPADGPAVRALYITVNRLLAPEHLKTAFETYIVQSLAEEMDRVEDYYRARDGGFWVALEGEALRGMFGLERIAPDAMELRRMYVDPADRRRGIARRLLAFAETTCRARGIARLELSTSELQKAALAFYRQAGYRLLREEVAEAASNKTLGGGIRRYYFEKALKAGAGS